MFGAFQYPCLIAGGRQASGSPGRQLILFYSDITHRVFRVISYVWICGTDNEVYQQVFSIKQILCNLCLVTVEKTIYLLFNKKNLLILTNISYLV